MPRDSGEIDAVIAFWRDAGPKAWFAKSDAFDAEIRDRFGALHARAEAGELDDWAETPQGALALILILDQFSRNLYRDDARAFASDEKALAHARAALDKGFDEAVATSIDPAMRQFIYMPFMHSENLADQDLCLSLFRRAGNEEGVKYAHIHRDIIVAFGRFRHRNPPLGRETTEAEKAFLGDGGFKG